MCRIDSVTSGLMEMAQILTALECPESMEYQDLLLLFTLVAELDQRLWGICGKLLRSSSLDRDELLTLLKLRYNAPL